MAVNRMRNGDIHTKVPQMDITRRDSETSRSASITSSSGKGLKHGKKELKKPELERYRPGMGLHQKNTKLDESSNAITLQKLCITDELHNSLTVDPATKSACIKAIKHVVVNTTKENPTLEKGESSSVLKKNNKNRRPDQQVYMPKHRVAAKLKGLSDDSAGDSDPKAGETDTRSPSIDKEFKTENEKVLVNSRVNSDPSLQGKSTSNKRMETKKSRNNRTESYKSKNISSSSVNNYFESSSSCSSSRSTPEGFSTEKLPVLLESLNFVNSNMQCQETFRDLTSNSNDTTHDSRNGNENKISNSICWGDTEFEGDDKECLQAQDVSCVNKAERNVEKPTKSSKTQMENSTTNKKQNRPSEGKFNSNLEAGKNAKNGTKHQGRERNLSGKEENSKGKGSNNLFDHKDKNNRKNKRERSDPPSLPPRFQKQNQNNNHSDPLKEPLDVRSGGILVVPSNSLAIKPPKMAEKNYSGTSPLQHSPPQLYVHKQLFNPKNPKSPEIINVPAPASVPHFDVPNYCDYIQRNDMLDYGPAPVLSPVNNGYIPPPQPPTIRRPYEVSNINFSRLTDAHENSHGMLGGIAPPVMCPVPNMRMMAPPVPPAIYQNDYIMPPESEKKRLKPIVEKNLKEISLLERELNSHLAKGVSTADLNALRQCRWKLQLRYENIILADPRYCAEKNAEQHLWKSAYYQIIEALRKSSEEQPQNKELKDNLLNLVHEGAVFYENLLEKQQETYGFSLAKLLEVDGTNGPCFPESIRIVLISSQKILIYLGDLARYKEQTGGTTNFGKARNWYLKAQQLAPKNGRPYHQLAVLALCARRKLDAVYYFIRSLAASNPFLSAREYLLTLFEDAKKKYERCEKKRQDDLASEKAIIAADTEERSEVWIKPDGTSSQRPTVLEEDRDAMEFQKLSNVELNKRFVTSFLHVHGKLYTKVGMDTFNEVLTQMLKEFNHLLQRVPTVLESTRLLQLSAINMHAVANASLKDSNFIENGCPLLLVQALHVSQAMMSLLMQRCCTLHKLHLSSPEYPKQLISYDVAQLLPVVKIWTDWMACQLELWVQLPLYTSDFLDTCMELDVWTSFADLLTCLSSTDISSPQIAFAGGEGYEPVLLEEDNTLSGFVPLLGAPLNPAYAMPPLDKERARQCVRVSRIQFFGDYLCGIPTPYLQFDVEHKRFISLVSVGEVKDGNNSRKDMFESHKDDSCGDESLESIDDTILQSSPDDHGNSEIKMLWSRKEALSRAKARQDKYQAQVLAVLQKNQRQRPIILQIQPRYLVPDTNCFIDHLQHLKNILETGTFHLVVPLVVINELDGLARGTRPNPHSTPEHANKVTNLSRASISFLEEKFAVRNAKLRAITSKGSVMDTIGFRAEEMGHNKRGNNDDLILSCCLFYCKDRAELYMPKHQDEPLQLNREVVLLTDDRHLRVKALTHNVPARDMTSFLQWVNS